MYSGLLSGVMDATLRFGVLRDPSGLNIPKLVDSSSDVKGFCRWKRRMCGEGLKFLTANAGRLLYLKIADAKA